MTYHFQNMPQDQLFDLIRQAKVIAVVGLSDREDTASYRVARYLKEQGYKIIPVNPKKAGQSILGALVYANLEDIPISVDIVDVFRRSEFLPQVAEDFLKIDAGTFWAQLGLENQKAEMLLRRQGCTQIVMNQCLKIVHQAMLAEKS